jgi:hypothetical protein
MDKLDFEEGLMRLKNQLHFLAGSISDQKHITEQEIDYFEGLSRILFDLRDLANSMYEKLTNEVNN